MCLLWIALAFFFFVHRGLNMVNKVIKRGENIVLTCDEVEFNNFDALKSSAAEQSNASTLPKFSWFIKPFGKRRRLLASCTDTNPDYKGIFEILPEVDGVMGNLGCIVKSTNASLVPAGTYECLKFVPDQKKFLSELVIMEEEPICRLVTKENNKEIIIYSNSDKVNSSFDVDIRSISNGTPVTIHCSSNYSGHLVHNFRISLIGTTTNYGNKTKLSQSFLSSFDFDVTFDDFETVNVSLSISFQSQLDDFGSERILSEIPVYEIHFPLVLVPSKEAFYITSQMTLKTGEILNEEHKKNSLDGTALIVVGVLIAMLLFVVFIFSFCYFQMNKRMRDFQTASAQVSGESVPYHLREANSLYDEINLDEEILEFSLNVQAYTKLNQNTLLKKAEDGEVDSKLGSSSKRSTYVHPGEMIGNIYLDLVSSTNQKELRAQSKNSNSIELENSGGKDGSFKVDGLKVNNGSYLHIPMTSEHNERSLSVDMTYLHALSESDKVSNNSSTYENTYS